jgi:glucose/arabinose dehydrogenase
MRLLTALTLALLTAPALAATEVGNGFTQPVLVTSAPGDARLFVVEKAGRIKVLGAAGPAWLDISAQVDASGERGLLGLAFDPGFASNGRFYVDYIDKTSLNTVVAAYTASGSSITRAGTVLTVAQPAGLNNHKAGWIGFSAADPGQLYIATGDGGSGNDPDRNAQNLSSNLGKLLRVTPSASGSGYSVPTSNPFVGVAGNDEIWAYGLRNPYRNSFDRQTGDLWIGDVGQGSREEIDFASAAAGGGRGANYGWRALEGSGDNPGVSDPAPAGAVGPIHDYGRSLGGSVIGGYVYRGGADATLQGRYVFGDFVSGRIWSLKQVGGVATEVAELASPFGGFTLSSFGEGSAGELYAVGLNGQVFLLAGAAPVPEPSALALLAAGLGLIFIRRRRA